MIVIEKSAGQFYKIISQIWPVFKFIDSERNKGKSCVKYIYFYDMKFTKYMKFTKFTIYRLKTMNLVFTKQTKSPRCDSLVDNSHAPPVIKDKSWQKVQESDKNQPESAKKVTN